MNSTIIVKDDLTKYWLIAYRCRGTEAWQEDVHHGTLGEWRLKQMKYNDGPYILVAAHEISKREYDKLNGYIG